MERERSIARIRELQIELKESEMIENLLLNMLILLSSCSRGE